MVALRFPEASEEMGAPEQRALTGVEAADRVALFSPDPISPGTAARLEAAPPVAPPEQSSVPLPEQAAVPLPTPAPHVVPHHKPEKPPAPVHKVANRPGFVLNDAQIANIKRRLQLSPDQERMWPAVEAALRSIAYAKAHEGAHRRVGHASGSQLANIDPNSPEVQGLKSAAFPLILSFNSEQKSEVRTLAHVMGLDQLASQF
jgi:hypothetical protein